jgi:hypothetical protein
MPVLEPFSRLKRFIACHSLRARITPSTLIQLHFWETLLLEKFQRNSVFLMSAMSEQS